MTDPIVDSAVIKTMFSAPSMAVQPRMSDGLNHFEMLVPAEFWLEVIDDTWCCSDWNTPSASSTM